MSSAVLPEMAVSPDYASFIREAFIAPIRSVAVVDDEYPTLDKFLERQLKLESPVWQISEGPLASIAIDKLEKLQKVVDVCRDTNKNWMLDVYDGIPMKDSEGQQRFAQRLHHSDLLILDYHLEGDSDERGEQALGILKQLGNVDHFNLVVVHTKGYRSAEGNVDAVLVDIIVSLLCPTFKAIPQKLAEKLDDGLNEWNDADPSINERLLESINHLDFLAMLRDCGGTDRKLMLDTDYSQSFRGVFKDKPDDIALNEECLFWYIMTKVYETISPHFNQDGVSHVDWGKDGDVNWVSTEKLFVTIVGKNVDASDLPERLVHALVQWNPHPHKLLMAKMRHELDDKGIAIATEIVGNQYVQAHWLDMLVSAERDALPTEVWSVIEKHWDELASRTKDTLSCFAQNMIACLKKDGDAQSIKERYIKPEVMAENNKILANANCFNCSKSVTGHHLTTGHILKIDQSYWLCLSPACDLVPGQKTSKQLGNNMPVKLVRLHDARTACSEDGKSLSENDAIESALKVASRNEMLFLNIGGSIKAFCFASVHGKANPKWEQYYAANKGVFQDQKKLTLKRVAVNDSGVLELKAVDAEVVMQLRYEYALNLLQKLGATMSRIGLDFAGLHTEEEETV